MGTYRSNMTAKHFLSADVAGIVANRWIEVGEYQVEAGVYYALGFGYSNSQSDADGRIYAKLMDSAGTAVEITGIVRFAAYTPDDLPIKILCEIPTSKLNSSATDMTKQLPFPVQGDPTFLGQDYKIKIFVKADSVGNGTLDKDNTVLSIDVTKRSKAG